MAAIPEFQRQKLASSVVGTAGIDRSGEAAFGAIADSTRAVAKILKY